MKHLAAAVLLLALGPFLTAQDQKALPTKDSTWRNVGEFGIAGADNDVVAKGTQLMHEFIAAGVADGENEKWTNLVFLTPETLAAVPLRMGFWHDARETGHMRDGPFVTFDHQKKIDFGEMFASMGAEAMQGENAWVVKRMHMCSVARPDGGYRLNFGGKNVFGEAAGENPLFTTYTDVRAKAENEALMSRLRQMPIFGSFDFRKVMSGRENKEIVGLFGPRAGLVSASLTVMGKRPALDLYSAIRPGEGLVGAYLAKQPGHARVLGSLNVEPKLVFAADLGKEVPRTVLSLARTQGKGGDLADVMTPLLELLEVWTGELTLVATAVAPPLQIPKDDFDSVFERLGKSFEGNIVFGVEEGTGAEVVKSLEKFLAGDEVKQSEFGIEPTGEGDRRSFRISGQIARSIGTKHISLGAAERLFVISFGDSATKSLDLRDGALKKQGTVPMPMRLGLAQGPLKLWIHHDLLRYVNPWMTLVRRFLFGAKMKARIDWVQKQVGELLSENLVVSLSWTSRTGAMLRALF